MWAREGRAPCSSTKQARSSLPPSTNINPSLRRGAGGRSRIRRTGGRPARAPCASCCARARSQPQRLRASALAGRCTALCCWIGTVRCYALRSSGAISAPRRSAATSTRPSAHAASSSSPPIPRLPTSPLPSCCGYARTNPASGAGFKASYCQRITSACVSPGCGPSTWPMLRELCCSTWPTAAGPTPCSMPSVSTRTASRLFTNPRTSLAR